MIEGLLSTYLLSLTSVTERPIIMIPILQMAKASPKKSKSFAEGHTVNEW